MGVSVAWLASRSDTDRLNPRLLALIEQTPSLQKIGQILARNASVPEDLRSSLQQLENGIMSTRASDLQQFIRESIGEEEFRSNHLQLDDEILAEATVGAVIGVRYQNPGTPSPQRGVCKVVKPAAVQALEEDLQILDAITLFFEEHSAHYELGEIPLSQLFQEVRNALTREVQTVQEQVNLRRAGEYFLQDRRIQVPAILPFSTPSVMPCDGARVV